MTLRQKRAYALVLAVSAIAVSAFLWAEIVRSQALRRTQASVVPSLSLSSVSTVHPAAESSVPVPIAPVAAVTSPDEEIPSRPLLPSLRFPSGISSSRRSSPLDERTSEEMKQWELREAYGISIPALSLRAPVLLPSSLYWNQRAWDSLERQMQVGLLSGTVAYPHSVAPGASGTIIVSGHSSPPNERAAESRYGNIFARLPELAIGDQVILRTADASFTYVVTGTRIVAAADTTILAQQGSDPLLLLITCYPVGTTRERFVITARLRSA